MNHYRSLKDIVYDYVCDQITRGKLKPNERIDDSRICTELGISRTPVREASMQLGTEGEKEALEAFLRNAHWNVAYASFQTYV